LCVFGSNWCNG